MRTSLKISIACAMIACLVPAAWAETYYRNATGIWTLTSAWGTNPDGSGTKPSSFNAGDSYYTNGIAISTSTNADGATFAGVWRFTGTGTALNGASTQLAVKSVANVKDFSVNLMESSADIARLALSSSGVVAGTTFTVGTLNVISGEFWVQANNTSYNFQLNIGTLTGPGKFVVETKTSSAGLTLAIGNTFSNAVELREMSVTLGADLLSTGALTIASSKGTIALNGHSLAFNSITYGSKTYDTEGSVSVADLNAFLGGTFFTGTGNISIGSVVPEPATVGVLLGLGCAVLALVCRRKRQ